MSAEDDWEGRGFRRWWIGRVGEKEAVGGGLTMLGTGESVVRVEKERQGSRGAAAF